jgi:hypothetical protein
MRSARWLVALGLCAVVVMAIPAAAQADSVSVTCTGGCTGWHTGDVTVVFTVQGSSPSADCSGGTVNFDTPGKTYECLVYDSGHTMVTASQIVTIKRDATAPTLSSVSADRSPDSNGWYTHSVHVTASGSDGTSGIASCTSTTYSGPDSSSASVSGSCTDNAGNHSASQSVSFRYDASGPSVSGSASRGPDANGWYNHPVDVTFTGSDGASGVASCTSGSYSGPDSGSASVTGSCKDNAGNSGNGSLGLHYDATAPSVTSATPDRQPDANGWYNHPVKVTFAGTDATSGIANCDAITYGGPQGGDESVTGTCHDNAGNASAPNTFKLKYDSTPPKLETVAAAPLDKGAELSWKVSSDAVDVQVMRMGPAGSTPVKLYDGKRISKWTVKKLRNGNHYKFSVVATDIAGNAITRTIAVTPQAALYAPKLNAVVHGRPMLRWRSVKKASYYNVQLWFRGKKVFTTWPAGPGFRIPAQWSYLGHTYSFGPGKWVWYVFPGFGPRSKHKYGPLLGKGAFVAKK